jgi:hypothetical protein
VVASFHGLPERFFGEIRMIATTIFRPMRSNLSFSRRSRSAVGFVPFLSLETSEFGDPEKRLKGVVFLGLGPTAMPNSSDSSVVADATFLPQTLVVPPSGFEFFFSKSAEIFAAAEAGGPPDMARILAISEEHGIEFVPPLAIG